ncbi:hypothetical protein JHL17_11300 [Azospirillum sp. YIM B02556]|uniref:Uncharacterized protein n=1 Tax=Azospirillum endophyticum TaxID=2800326 RepID=A0ABS1F3I5_9PROT|nr:hypothetical protein [Azospirillum endophyticum]MBK1837999.1 hypothetical protein [Azospirillum endophyticum]
MSAKDLEKALAHARAALVEATAAVETLRLKYRVAESGFAAAEERRRDVSVKAALGDQGASEELRTATTARDDARTLMEDLQLALQQAEAAIPLRQKDVTAAVAAVNEMHLKELAAVRVEAAERVEKAMAEAEAAYFAYYEAGAAIIRSGLPLNSRQVAMAEAGAFLAIPFRLRQDVLDNRGFAGEKTAPLAEPHRQFWGLN